jgi:hypothetical protein
VLHAKSGDTLFGDELNPTATLAGAILGCFLLDRLGNPATYQSRTLDCNKVRGWLRHTYLSPMSSTKIHSILDVSVVRSLFVPEHVMILD